MSQPDILPLRKIDHVRFFVGNARQAAYFYRNAFGFDVVAYAGLETKSKAEAGYVLKQGDITFVVVSPLSAHHPENKRLLLHGDGVQAIAHVVGNVEEGKMNEWVKFYEDVMGFKQLISFDDKDISTEYSALMSKVVSSGTGRIKFPINEPAKAKRRSQIDEYLNFYYGP